MGGNSPAAAILKLIPGFGVYGVYYWGSACLHLLSFHAQYSVQLFEISAHPSPSPSHSVSSNQKNLSQSLASCQMSALPQHGPDHVVVSWQCRRKERYKFPGLPQKGHKFLPSALALSPGLWLTDASQGGGEGLGNTGCCHTPCVACSRQQETCVCVESPWH